MLNEKRAWEFLAFVWSSPQLKLGTMGQPVATVHIGGRLYPCWGLCACIYDLMYTEQINLATYTKMNLRISEAREREGVRDIYMWPLNARGAESRAAFCRQQAERLHEWVDPVKKRRTRK